jgi:hypothetical protein
VRNDTLEDPPESSCRSAGAALIQPACHKLDALDAQVTRLIWLVLVPRLDDRLGLVAAGEELEGFHAHLRRRLRRAPSLGGGGLRVPPGAFK